MDINKFFLRWIAVFGMLIVFAVSGWGAIAYRSGNSASATTGNLTINKPTGVVSGDVMIASIAIRPDTASVTAPSGWNSIRTVTNSGYNKLLVFYKIAGGGEPASYAWTMSGSPTYYVGGILAFSGVDTSSPIIVENGQTADSKSFSTPSVNVTAANAMIVTSHEHHSAYTWSPPSGMTERVDVRSPTSNNGTGIDLEINTVIQAASGMSGVKTATAGDSDRGASHILALRPYVGETPPVMGNVPNQTSTVGTAFTLDIGSYVTQTNGDAITGYTLTGTLPAGLNFNTTTGVINGTPTAVTASTSFSVTATDNDGTSNADTFTITVIPIPPSTSDFRDFTKRTSFFAQGEMVSIGNTFTVAPKNDATTANCSTYTNGSYIDPITTNNSNRRYCHYNVDGVQGSAATTAQLIIPSGSKIKWAGLYWQALTPHRTTSYDTQTIQIRRDENGTAYQTVPVTHVDYQSSYSNDITPVGSSTGATSADIYSAYADVTSLFKTQGWLGGNYTVKTSDVLEGQEDSFGVYSAWNLIVVYENTDPAYTYKSFTVFDGWKEVWGDSSNPDDVLIPISGFYTPKTTPINARVTVFAAEGDYNINGDKLKALRKSDNTLVEFLNSNNPTYTNQTFSSRVFTSGTRTPSQTNNNGIDIQSFDIGTATTYNLLQTQQTSMDFHFTSTQDLYFPSVLAFSTELYAPQLCYDYSYKQDGQYLKADNNGTQLPLLSGTISTSPIETSIYLRNKEADFDVSGVSFYTDLNISKFTYVAGSTATSTTGGTALNVKVDSYSGGCSWDSTATATVACNDGHNVRIGLGDGADGYGRYTAGALGSEDAVYAKFAIQPVGMSSISTVNESLGLKLNYYIKPAVDADEIPYTYILGQNLNLCPPSSGYTPVWGTFNVIDRNAGTYSSNGQTLPTNNLRTQVSRKSFAVDVAAYGKHTDNTYTIRPTADINTTVLVEMIDNDAFHDANASCANPDSNISKAIYVPLTITAGAGGDMTDPVPTQLLPYYNFAVKNAAFRIWYFNDKDDLLIQNWTANVSDPDYKLNLQSISGLYKSATHTLCVASCGDPSGTNCFKCIKENYAKPLCSRDNFAVRPESYDLRIYDINQSLVQTDPIKDGTKIDLSTQYQYTPQFGASIGRINLAAGYNYRYDMNATGNDTNLAKVPGYTRYFNGANSDYNATMIWKPEVGHITTGCNDTTGKTLSLYVANGQMTNNEQNQTQVGEYRLNIIDPAWTAVDWKNSLLTHHTSGFLVGDDCIEGSTVTVSDSDGKVGCLTSSAHIGGGFSYKDHNLRLKPAKFDVSSIVYGVGKTPLVIGTGGSGYVYNSNLGVDNDMAMAVHTYGPIKAVGYSGETLSNFVKECYATDLNVSISHDANTSLPFIGRMSVAETNGTQVFDSLKFSVQNNAVQTIEDTYFGKSSSGQTVPNIRLNFDRNATTPVESQIVHYGDFNVSCLVPSDCNMSAAFNTTPNTALGSDLMDFNVTHAYGRVVARKVTVMGLIAFDALAKYEVYKNNNLLGTPLAADQFDSDWFVNTLHTDANYGDANVTVIDPATGSLLPVHTDSVNGVETYKFNPFTIRQGYKAHIDTEGWLWYGGINALPYADPNGPAQAGADNLSCMTHPCFDISMGRVIGNTGSAKTESEDHKANKNTSSGTGWNTTREYAPAVR